jgi:hypothetical protein
MQIITLKKTALLFSSILTFLILFGLIIPINAQEAGKKSHNGKNFKNWSWDKINSNADWSSRAGLQVLNHSNQFYLFGGRTPIDPATLPSPIPGASIIWGDVWKSNDFGVSWTNLLHNNDTQWPARAYFQAVSKGKYMYIMGGQNFNIIDKPGCEFLPLPPGVPCPLDQIPNSDFFNDVWRSENGIDWIRMTEHAEWSGRAGLSAVVYNDEIYVMGGSVNDDSSITPNGPARIYFNDVWKSTDGSNWELVTENAPWAARAGGIAVVKDNYIYMIGGEDGFICNEQTPRCPPYYNDVWRTKNGVDWELVTDNAPWIARPGHQVVVAQDRLVLFGGFGLGPDINIAANPKDIWISNKGKNWKKVSDSPWNAIEPSEIKYDFDAVVVKGKHHNEDMIFTFGGDRETFNFFDPFNHLNVDNDVWKFSLFKKYKLKFYSNYPNPFKNKTNIVFQLPKKGKATLKVYNLRGRLVKDFNLPILNFGKHKINWNGKNNNDKKIKSGLYILKLDFNGQSLRRLILKK